MLKKYTAYILQAWLVLLLSLLYGGALAGVQLSLSGLIAENKKNETYSVIPDLVSGAVKEQIKEIIVTGLDEKPVTVWQANQENGEQVGWVIPAVGQGFADKIEVIIGIDKQCETITGLYVLNQKETPGLGDYITSEDFLSRFTSKALSEPLKVVKRETLESNEIQPLTGATISSESVCDIVNQAIENVRESLIRYSNP